MGKKTADRINRTKKRLNQLVTDPTAAMGDLEKHVQKTVRGPIKTSQKNMKKTQEGFVKLITNTGNIIKRRKLEMGAAAVGFTVGMTISEAMKVSEYPYLLDTSVEKEVVLQRMTFEDYIEMGTNNPSELTHDEWTSFISLISRKLEHQLRYRLDLPIEKKYNMLTLLKMASENECLQREDCNLLHRFRSKERNPNLHAQKEKVDQYELVVQSARLVQGLENEIISEYQVSSE